MRLISIHEPVIPTVDTAKKLALLYIFLPAYPPQNARKHRRRFCGRSWLPICHVNRQTSAKYSCVASRLSPTCILCKDKMKEANLLEVGFIVNSCFLSAPNVSQLETMKNKGNVTNITKLTNQRNRKTQVFMFEMKNLEGASEVSTVIQVKAGFFHASFCFPKRTRWRI